MRQWSMLCLSMVDMNGQEEIGRGFYIMKGKVGWKIYWDTSLFNNCADKLVKPIKIMFKVTNIINLFVKNTEWIKRIYKCRSCYK